MPPPPFEESLSSETRFSSGYMFRLRVSVWTFGKAFRMQECAIFLGSCSFREGREKCKVSVKGPESRRQQWSVCFFCQPGGAHDGKGDSHGAAR